MPVGEGSGHRGPLISLSGMEDKTEQGRQAAAYTATIPATSVAVGVTLLSENPRRIAALIWRDDTEPTRVVTLILGDGAYGFGGDILAQLWPRGVLQIDKDLPWVGGIRVSGGSALSTADIVIHALEISLP